jgi:permease of the major facilitator family protein
MTVGVTVPVAVAVVVLGCMWIPRDDGDRNREHLLRRLDPVGAALLGVAIVGVMLPFMLASQKPWAWWFLPGGLATLAVWWGWELALSHRGRGEAMVDPSLFRIPSFTLGSAMITVFFAGMTSVMVIEALFIQRGLGRSALVSGLVVLPAALAQVYSAPLAGRLVRTWGRKVVVWGLWINVLGLALIGAVALLLTDGGSVWWLVPASLPLGFGNGWVASPNQALTLREVPVSTGGTASGIMQTGQRIATAVGSAAVTGIFFHNVSDGYPRALVLSFTVICGFMVAALALSYVDERLARGTSLFDDVGDGGLDGKD